MYLSSLPEPWMIVELERLRRDREPHREERPSLQLPLPPLAPPRSAPASLPARTVVVIDLA